MKICLDAGHYGYYNQSPANKSYYESKMVWKLHLKLKKSGKLRCSGHHHPTRAGKESGVI